jgi:prolipoprotein diacylglyceryltransferase
LGNWINQELYGLPTGLPWGIFISQQRYHPLFAYEMVLNSVVLGIMLWLERHHRLPWGRGAYLAVYLAGYGAVRFILEYLRIEPWRLGVLTTAQWVSFITVIIGCVWLAKVRRQA